MPHTVTMTSNDEPEQDNKTWKLDETLCNEVINTVRARKLKAVKVETSDEELKLEQLKVLQQAEFTNSAIFEDVAQDLEQYNEYKSNVMQQCFTAMTSTLAEPQDGITQSESMFKRFVMNALTHDVENQIVLEEHKYINNAFVTKEDENDRILKVNR